MKKFAVFSGFLGSGKTTTMMALTRYFTCHHGKAAMISNDLGGPGLADHRLASLSGCQASELTGTCICYQTENLTARLDSLFDKEQCELVMSDIPGFGIGALDHVYHKLEQQFPGQYPLAPFTVLCEPKTVLTLQAQQDPDLCYILRSQLLEADLIVLNKCDLITESQKNAMVSWLQTAFQEARVLTVSAVTGEGLEELSQALIRETASLRSPDLAYGGPDFTRAMGRVTEYYLQYYAVVCCRDFSGTDYLQALAQAIRSRVRQAGADIPHMKLLAWTPEGDFGKADLLGIDREIQIARAFSSPCTELAVVLNASAFCPKETLDRITSQAVYAVSEDFQLTVTIYKKECFGAMEGAT